MTVLMFLLLSPARALELGGEVAIGLEGRTASRFGSLYDGSWGFEMGPGRSVGFRVKFLEDTYVQAGMIFADLDLSREVKQILLAANIKGMYFEYYNGYFRSGRGEHPYEDFYLSLQGVDKWTSYFLYAFPLTLSYKRGSEPYVVEHYDEGEKRDWDVPSRTLDPQRSYQFVGFGVRTSVMDTIFTGEADNYALSAETGSGYIGYATDLTILFGAGTLDPSSEVAHLVSSREYTFENHQQIKPTFFLTQEFGYSGQLVLTAGGYVIARYQSDPWSWEGQVIDFYYGPFVQLGIQGI